MTNPSWRHFSAPSFFVLTRRPLRFDGVLETVGTLDVSWTAQSVGPHAAVPAGTDEGGDRQ